MARVIVTPNAQAKFDALPRTIQGRVNERFGTITGMARRQWSKAASWKAGEELANPHR